MLFRHAFKVAVIAVALTMLGQSAYAAEPEPEPTTAAHDDWSWWDHDDEDQATDEWGDHDQGDWSDLVGFAANNGEDGGFWVLTKNGDVFAQRGAPDLGGPKADRHYVAMASHPTRSGYWVLDSKGGVHAFGRARKRGSAHFDHAVGIAAVRSGGGYWVASAHGKVASFGAAPRFGDLSRFDVAVDRITALDEADGYYLHTTEDR